MGSQNYSVLFVDDEPNVVEALKRLLIDEPYEVRTCTDPEEALKLVAEDPPTVVVADYYMPKMKGPALLRKVREMDKNIVRMVLTGKPDVTAVLDAVKEGAVYRFILKPWDEDDLKMNLRQAIDYRRLVGERNTLLREVREQRSTIEELEKSTPGISKLPKRDESGAYVLTEDDLPKKR